MLFAHRVLLPNRYTTRHAGYYGGRCPVCFALTNHRMRNFGTRLWLLGVIPLPAKYLINEGQCLECGVYRGYPADQNIDPSAQIDPDVEMFTAMTNPRDLILDTHGFDFTRDDILSESLSDEQRQYAMYMILDGMRYEFERAHTLAVPGRLGVVMGFVVSYTLVANLLLLIALIAVLPGNSASPTGAAAIVVGIVAVISMGLGAITVLAIPVSLWIWLTRRERTTRTRVMPRLVAALVPLYPKEGELEMLLQGFRGQGMAIGKVVKPRKLARAVEYARLKAGWGVGERAGVC